MEGGERRKERRAENGIEPRWRDDVGGGELRVESSGGKGREEKEEEVSRWEWR